MDSVGTVSGGLVLFTCWGSGEEGMFLIRWRLEMEKRVTKRVVNSSH